MITNSGFTVLLSSTTCKIFSYFKVNFVINGVDFFLDEVYSKIRHFLVSEILTLGNINLHALWDFGDEFWNKFKKCAVRICGDHAESIIEVFVCHMSPKTWQKDSGFFCFEIKIWSEIDVLKIFLLIRGFFVMLKNMVKKNSIWEMFFEEVLSWSKSTRVESTLRFLKNCSLALTGDVIIIIKYFVLI